MGYSINTVVLPSTTSAGSGNTPAIGNGDGIKGALIIVDVTAASGTGHALALTLQVADPVTGNNVTLATIAADISGTGTYTYLIYPAAVASITPVYPVLPAGCSIGYAITGTTPSYTFSISACLLQ